MYLVRDGDTRLAPLVQKGQRQYKPELTEGSNASRELHRLPPIGRDPIILPSGLLERIERQSVGFAKHADTAIISKACAARAASAPVS